MSFTVAPTFEHQAKVSRQLRQSSLFGVLSEAELDQLGASCRFRRCVKGEPIWLSGEDSSFIGLVVIGFVRMVKTNPNGSEMTAELMGPGQTFGLLGVLAGCGCPLMAYGLTNTSYLAIPKTAFMNAYESSSALKDVLLRRTAIRMHGKIDFMSKLSAGSADERLAAVLLTLSESYGQVTPVGTELEVPLTRQALAEMSGLTTETVIRTLSRWTQGGLISTDQQQITIVNPPALEEKVR